MPYPKKMINSEGTVVLAKQEIHGAALRLQGFHDAPVEVASEPAGCPNCQALAAKVADLEAQLAARAPANPKPLETLKAGELLAYAQEHHLDIGDLKAQHGAEKILAAVKAAEAAKAKE